MVALYELTACDAAQSIRTGTISSEELVRASLARIAVMDPRIEAWTFLDADYALKQARRADRARKDRKTLGPLHGVPVGVKDVFDTADMPTENGTVLHAGRRPSEDATVVALLRQAGAVLLGKTVCTELGLVAPAKTRNPHDPGRTPGGSSSGSAAAVAAEMVPLATGSQNNGSVIRPASYCGVYGYKPTCGRISRHGVLRQSPSLDQIGVFGRTVEDVALLAQELMIFDPRDAVMRPAARDNLLPSVRQDPAVEPRLAFIKTPVWDQATEATRHALARLVAQIGHRVREVSLPSIFDSAHAIHRTVMEPELALNYAGEYATGKERLSSPLCQIIERGQATPAVEYLRAQRQASRLVQALDELLAEYDAILTPATPGEAPAGLQSTGSPTFCTIWTLCGVPAVSMPLLRGESGMPLGVQVVARRGQDARLLRTARWLWQTLGPPR
jgi:Asp-tRNA(Asn)/Glu-tRNA(Gln) amidotransferase A subunit family amidase